MSSHEPSPSYEAVLRELQSEFVALLPERVEELRSALTLLATDPAARAMMQRLGHRIAGTAGTVDLADVGLLGRAIERYVSRRTSWARADLERLEGVIALLDEWTVEASRSEVGSARSPLTDPRFAALAAAQDAP